MINKWKGTLTRRQAIQLIDRATDKDDPFWENVISDYYDEKTDSWPSIYHVMEALGVSTEEFKEATGEISPKRAI